MVVEVKVFLQKLPLPNNNSRALTALWRWACRAALELGIPSPARIQPLQLSTHSATRLVGCKSIERGTVKDTATGQDTESFLPS